MPVIDEIVITQQVSINYYVVLLAAVVYMLLGLLWYSPVLFGNRKNKYDDAQRYEDSPFSLFVAYMGEFLVSLLISSGLAFFIGLSSANSYGGMLIAFLVWLCFVASNQGSSVIWSRKTGKSFFVHSSFTFVGYLLMGLILGWMG